VFLSWFRLRGPYVQQWRARGTILLSTGGACSGESTSKAGEEVRLPSPWLKMLWEKLENEYVVCEGFLLSVVL
jgi:hypothetical protein